MVAEAESVAETASPAEELDEGALPAFSEPEFAPVQPESAEEEVKPARKPLVRARVEEEEEEPVLESEEETEVRKRQKSKHKRRELVFDENRGQVVARRRRKGSRKRDEWEDYLEE
jgi:hypothetical protein